MIRVAFIAAFVFAPAAPAQVMLGPVAASTNMGNGIGTIENTINQSGLSTPYSPGFTGFASYIASGPTHDCSDTNNNWISTSGRPTGSVNFDLGASFDVSSFVLWNTDSIVEDVLDFVLVASQNSAFANPVTLGSFSAADPGPDAAVPAQVFTFPTTNAEFFQMQIMSNVGLFSSTSFGEAAFGGVVPVPEPSSLAMGALVVGFAGLWRCLFAGRHPD